MNNESMYSSFNNIPWKLIRSGKIFPGAKLRPLHIKLYPTNRCNANCKWCCYGDIDRKVELDIEEIRDILYEFQSLGTLAMTISGGGEPTLHPNINDILKIARTLNIECGLITNGLLWGKNEKDLTTPNDILTWARMSVVETVGDYDINIIKNFSKNLPNVDLGVSFVVTKDVNIKTAEAICNLINNIPNIKHIKFIQDSYLLDTQSMELIIKKCKNLTNKAFFIWRDSYKKGNKNCLVSLVKPVIDAWGYVQPCCDTQHSDDLDVRFMPNKFRLCKWNEFRNSLCFDGSNCKKCYYDVYNEFLIQMTDDFIHDKFF